MYNNLGALEELILLIIMVIEGEVYTVPIARAYKEQTGKTISIPAIHTVLRQLEKKGFVESSVGGATASRGGRSKRIYRLTALGYQTIKAVHEKRNELWAMAPKLTFN